MQVGFFSRHGGDTQWRRAWDDVIEGIKAYRVWWTMARFDIGQRYKRSVIGPFWLTITMAVYILGVGPLYSLLFKQDVAHYLPHLAIGLIAWSLMTNILLEGCVAFSGYRNMLISTRLPFTVYIMRVVSRNLVIFLHNLVAYLPFMIYLRIKPEWEWLIAIPGLLLMMAALLPATYILSVLCTRYRDLQPIVASVMQLCFFLTPIIWLADGFSERASILYFNPLNWMIDIVRGPLLGRIPPAATYGKVALGFVVLLGIAVPLFARYRRRLSFWV